MRAQLLRTPGPIESRPLLLESVPEAAPQAGELAFSVTACGVCRTDLQLVEGDLEARRLPIIPGHQTVGRVVAVGKDVTGWKVGDRVGAGWFGGSCGSCDSCAAGRENLCTEAVFNGWDRDGGYAEQATVRAEAAIRLKGDFSDLDAAPLLCGGVIGYRSLKISGIRPGERLGLYGFGASALLVIQVAIHWGIEVYVATRSAAEQQRALDFGAVWAGSYDDVPPVALNAAITFAPVGEVVLAALRALDRGGIVAVNAIHLDRIPEFPYHLLWWERQLRSVANFTRQDAQEFMTLAVEIPIRTVVQTYGLEEANEALADLKAGRVHGAAVIVV
jgi:propanol-preferring alcohol dehydrogenase